MSGMSTGWCPGVLRPMQAGDGLIVRLKVTGGCVDLGLAGRIALWSRLWGNGQIELSSRANLQLRGLSASHLPDLEDALSEHGLLDASEAGEAVRNVIASPLAGLDPEAVLDVRPVTRALARRLSEDASLHGLPSKFGFAVDDGGLAGLGGVAADVGFVARRVGGDPAFEVWLDGAPGDRFGPCGPDGVVDTAVLLAKAFLRLRTGRRPGIPRMRDLVSVLGVDAVAREARLRRLRSGEAERMISPAGFLGVQRLGAGAFVGAGLPFGSVGAEDFATLAAAAAACGATELRLTPWRAILAPVPSIGAARRLAATPVLARFILDARDPRLRVAACVGAPGCLRAPMPVRRDAARLVSEMGPGQGDAVAIHVSGCEKSCAHHKVAPVTLIGRDGRYDLVRNGVASDPPAACDLTLDQVIVHLRGVAA